MKILLAYDGSEGARRALEQAAELATHDGGALSVVNVAELLPPPGRMGAMLPAEEDRERHHELSEAVAALGKKGIEATAIERKGEPAEMIIDEADKQGAELIVIGTRGLNDVKRWLLGSVSSKVVQHAPCDVLVVR